MQVRRLLGLSLALFTVGTHLTRAATGEPLEIPFKLYDGFAIVIRGSAGTQANLNFLVDTGAVPTAIHERLARKLKLKGEREDITVVNRSTAVERVEVRDLRFGGWPEGIAVSAVVVDLSPIEARLGVRLDAIIGLDVLGSKDFTIDYRGRRIRLGTPDAMGAGIPFEVRHQAGAPYLVLPVEIDSRRVSLLVDTGTDGLTLFGTAWPARSPALKSVRQNEQVDARGVHLIQQFEVEILRVGANNFGKVIATALPVAEGSATRDFDGMLGPVLLGITRIGFDFTNKKIFVEYKRWSPCSGRL